MPDYPKPRAGRVVGTLEAPYVPETAAVTDRAHLMMTRPWLEWCRRITGMAINGGGAGGDVVGPGSATADAIALFNGTTGKLIKDSLKTIAQLTTDIINAILPGGTLPVANLPAHHATHEQGGADQLVNAAWTNAANTFTANTQTIEAFNPRLRFIDLNQPVNARLFRISNSNSLVFRAMDDADQALQATPLILERDGDAVIGKDLTVTGSGGNVALRNVDNTFAGNQRIDKNTPVLTLHDTFETADLRQFRLVNTAQSLFFQSMTDAGGAQNTPLRLYRTGDVTVGNNLTVNGTGGNIALKNAANTFTGNPQTIAAKLDVTGGSGTGYSTAPIEIRTTATPRLSFYWAGLVASQIGMNNVGVIRTYDNPGTGYAAFACGGLTVTGHVTTVGGYIYPANVTTGGSQSTWYLASHPSYGLYANTGLILNGHLATAGGYIYPANIAVGGAPTQSSWYLASHSSWGLYVNTGLYLVGALYLDPAQTVNVGTTRLFSGLVRVSDGSSVGVVQAFDSVYRRLNFDATEFSWQISGGSFQMKIDTNGALLLGTTVNFQWPGRVVIAQNLPSLNGIAMQNTNTGHTGNFIVFLNSNQDFAGYINQTGALSVAYTTTSDQRLKRDRGVVTNLDGLRAVVVHDFEWIADGKSDRGIFAQETYPVFPRAVCVGSNGGDISKPWMTDYSKFVPDLIAGWQQHEARIAQLEGRS